MKLKILKQLLILCLLAIQVHTLNAAEQIGRVVKIRGIVKIKSKAGRIKTIKNGDSILEGDTLLSQSKSFAKILMKDDTLFQLGPKSKFSFETFKMKTKSDRQATYNLIQGKLRSLFTVKSKTRSLTIKTPTASMGIRGTEIVSDVYRYKGKIQTDIALISGKLEVTTHSKKKFFLNTGHMVELRKSVRGNVNMNKRKLPQRMFKSLKKGNKGGNIFLLDERQSSGEVKANDIKLLEPLVKSERSTDTKNSGVKLDSKSDKIVIKNDKIQLKTKDSKLSKGLGKAELKNRVRQKLSIKRESVAKGGNMIDLSAKKEISKRIKIKTRRKKAANQKLKNSLKPRGTSINHKTTLGTQTDTNNYPDVSGAGSTK